MSERLEKARQAVEGLRGLLDGLRGEERDLVEGRLRSWQDRLTELEAESARSWPLPGRPGPSRRGNRR